MKSQPYTRTYLQLIPAGKGKITFLQHKVGHINYIPEQALCSRVAGQQKWTRCLLCVCFLLLLLWFDFFFSERLGERIRSSVGKEMQERIWEELGNRKIDDQNILYKNLLNESPKPKYLPCKHLGAVESFGKGCIYLTDPSSSKWPTSI